MQKGKRETRERERAKSKTSSGDNRELKSLGEKQCQAEEEEERAYSAAHSADPYPVGNDTRRHQPSGSFSLVAPSSERQQQGRTDDGVLLARKWLKEQHSLPRSLDMLASEYNKEREQLAEEAEPAEDGDISGQGNRPCVSLELATRAAQARK
jgi:hypothetical protein